jgi:hypothetical protein
MEDLEERTVSEQLAEIKEGLARVESFLARLQRFEPMLADAARRMEGSTRWRRANGNPANEAR